MEPDQTSLLDSVHPFSIKSKGDRNLQHPIKDIINMVEGNTIRSRKTSILIFLIVFSIFVLTSLCCTGVQDLKLFLFLI